MDFSPTEVQRMLKEQVRRFAQRSYGFEERRAIVGSADGYSREHWRLFAGQGWLALPFAEEDGGMGGSAADLAVIMEEFGRANVVEPYLPTAVLCGGLIAALAEGERRAGLLGPLMAGELQLACAQAEPDSRYNLAAVATTARAEGDGVRLDGAKIAVLNAAAADRLLVVARESGGTTDRDGVSVFLVDADAAGLVRRDHAGVDGRRGAELDLAGVAVPASARLGPAGGALPALEAVVDRATVGVAAEAVGALEVLLEKTVEYSKTRKQFGAAIGTFQALQHRMADMFIECQLARSVTIMAAMTLDGGAPDARKAKAVSAAKSRVGRAIRKVGHEAVQIHGGVGMTDELDVGHLFRRVVALEAMFGNADHHTARYASL